MRDYHKEFCSKCKHKNIDEHNSPCKECIDAYFTDWKNPNRKFGKYYVKGGKDVRS